MPFAKADPNKPKVCNRCKIAKPRSEFNKQKQSKNAISSNCTSCSTAAWKESQKKWKAANPEAWRRRNKNANLKRAYGIGIEQHDAMMELQGGRCAICRDTSPNPRYPLGVDHCHATGAVRGLLCHRCNASLGGFRDRIDLLENARAYILAGRNFSYASA